MPMATVQGAVHPVAQGVGLLVAEGPVEGPQRHPYEEVGLAGLDPEALTSRLRQLLSRRGGNDHDFLDHLGVVPE
jgi:hypothetical protein